MRRTRPEHGRDLTLWRVGVGDLNMSSAEVRTNRPSDLVVARLETEELRTQQGSNLVKQRVSLTHHNSQLLQQACIARQQNQPVVSAHPFQRARAGNGCTRLVTQTGGAGPRPGRIPSDRAEANPLPVPLRELDEELEEEKQVTRLPPA